MAVISSSPGPAPSRGGSSPGNHARSMVEVEVADLVMNDPMVVTSIQFVALELACPRCDSPIALCGRLELTPDEGEANPCCVCERCGTTTYLALRPGAGAT